MEAWGMSKVLQQNRIYLHWEGLNKNACRKSSTNNNYPGQVCITSPIGGSNIVGYGFPIAYHKGNDRATGHSIRYYPEANNIPGLTGLTWETISTGSLMCQDGVNAGIGFPGLRGFNGNRTAYPAVNFEDWIQTGTLKDLSSLSNEGLLSIPCLFNTPVCNNLDWSINVDCTASYDGCCTGYGGHDNSELLYADDDNLGLDDYCASILNISTWGSSHISC